MSDAYRRTVTEMFKNDSSAIIDNGMVEHAAILFEMFFSNAKHMVRIFCRNLNPAVFDRPEVISAAKKAIDGGVCINLCVQHAIDSGSEFYEQLKDDICECKCPDQYKDAPNFAVMDYKGFRYEDNPNECKAKACANNPRLALKFAGIFDEKVCFAS